MNIYINPLSATSQCATIDDAAKIISTVLDNISYMTPAINAFRLQLHFDDRIESRELITGQSFTETINQFKKNKESHDLCRRWYLATRSNMKLLKHELNNGIVVKVTNDRSIANNSEEGEVHEALATQAEHWLSLCNNTVFTDGKLLVSYQEDTIREIENISTLNSLKALLPCYEPNKKHGKANEHKRAMTHERLVSSEVYSLTASRDKGFGMNSY